MRSFEGIKEILEVIVESKFFGSVPMHIDENEGVKWNRYHAPVIFAQVSAPLDLLIYSRHVFLFYNPNSSVFVYEGVV